jgi:hypothetical protein
VTAVSPEREAFLAERRKGIGGSDVAALMGCDPKCSAYQLWLEKTGRPDPSKKGKPAAMRRGNFLEPAILRRYAEVVRPAELQVGIPHAADGGWRRGNQDARAVMPDGGRRVVEAKSVNRNVFRADWGQPWSDEVPDRALCQGAWYGALDDADVIDFAVCVIPDDPDEVLGLTPDEVIEVSEFHVFQASRNRRVEDAIVEQAREFWHRNVLEGIPPPDDVRDAELRYPSHVDGVVQPATDEILPKLVRYDRLSKAENAIKKLRKDLRAQLLLFGKDAEAIGTAEGTPWLSMKEQVRAAHAVSESRSRVLRFTRWWDRLRP